MKLRFGLAMAMGVMLSAAAQAKDTALVMSNTGHRYAKDLSDTLNAARVADLLRQDGFDVVSGRGLSVLDMANLAEQALDNLTPGDRFLVILQGHFATTDAGSFMAEVRVRNPTRFTMNLTGFSVEAILAAAADFPGRSVVAMVTPNRTLGAGPGVISGVTPLDAPQGVTLVQGPGDQVFGFMRDVVVQKNATIAEASASNALSITGYVPDMEFGGQVSGGDLGLTEQDYWSVVQDMDTVAGYEAYLDAYPNGQFRTAARRAVEFLEDAPTRAAEAVEAGLGLDRADRRQIQADLTLLGYNTRGVDGVFGAGSRRAIANWQTKQNFESTAYLTGNQIITLREQARKKQAEVDKFAVQEAEEARAKDRDYWWETGRGRTEAGLRAYLSRYPNGEFSATARERLAELAPAVPTVSQAQVNRDRDQEQRLAGNPITRLIAEKALEQKGMNPGRVDGRFDRNTRAAIKAFQAREGLPQTGFIGQTTAVKLLNSQ